MNLVDAIMSLHPEAQFGTDFVVAQSGDPFKGPLGPEEIVFWNEKTLGKRDDAAIAAVVAKPGPAVQREAYGYAILNILTDDERAASLSSAVKTWDRLMIQARPTPFPEGNEKVGRFAKAIGTTPKSLFDRALGVGA